MPAKTKKTRKAQPEARAAKAAGTASTAKMAGTAKTASTAGIAKTAKAARPAKETAPRPPRRSSVESATLHFAETTIIRGDAVQPGETLPSGATHEIAGYDASGQPILKRKRFSIC